MSDYFRSRRSARKNRTQPLFPEDRFWVSQLGFPLVIAGLTIFLVRMAEATESKPPHWNTAPIIGAGIAAFGVQIVTTVITTCESKSIQPFLPLVDMSLDCSDCYPGPKSTQIGVAINFVRLAWGFVS
jgi:hypothetical protein